MKDISKVLLKDVINTPEFISSMEKICLVSEELSSHSIKVSRETGRRVRPGLINKEVSSQIAELITKLQLEKNNHILSGYANPQFNTVYYDYKGVDLNSAEVVLICIDSKSVKNIYYGIGSTTMEFYLSKYLFNDKLKDVRLQFTFRHPKYDFISQRELDQANNHASLARLRELINARRFQQAIGEFADEIYFFIETPYTFGYCIENFKDVIQKKPDGVYYITVDDFTRHKYNIASTDFLKNLKEEAIMTLKPNEI